MQTIIEHYEKCLEQHGEGCKAVDWPNEKDAATRYKVMLEISKQGTVFSILDYGCGLGGLIDYQHSKRLKFWGYVGYDKSKKMIDRCRVKHPKYDWVTSLKNIPIKDYVLMNGVFTVKATLTNSEAWANMKKELLNAWQYCNVGLAFNVMSKNVDWERDDLFHVSLDELTKWVAVNLSRNFIIRSDYGLYENTIYIYR